MESRKCFLLISICCKASISFSFFECILNSGSNDDN